MYAPNMVSYRLENHYMLHLHVLEYCCRVVISFFFSPAVPVRANDGTMCSEKRPLYSCKVSGALPPGLQEGAAMRLLIRPSAGLREYSLLMVVTGSRPHRTQQLPNGPFRGLVIFFFILVLHDHFLYAWGR